jgi:lysine-specific demethylase 8
MHSDSGSLAVFQVVGEKRILLYHPDESENLYPYEGSFLNNTAQVDPEEPDYKTFPNYKNAIAWECHLKQGEMLYIPPKWWHHVRSLSTSFSVSFWWT